MEATFFTEKLEKFLNENHPDLVKNLGEDLNEYISEKANRANEIYESEITRGIHADAALELANEALKEGLIFSKSNTIENLLMNFFEEIYLDYKSKGQLNELIIKLVFQCDPVFQKYEFSDSYVYNDLLETELIGTVDLYFNSL